MQQETENKAIPKVDLASVMDVAQIQSIMNDFFAVTGIGMAIIDLAGIVLVSTGWQDICINFHRVHPNTLQNCLDSDIILSSGVPAGEFRLYKCKNNLWDIATPIILDEQHVGNLFLGQFLFSDEEPDRQFFLDQAQKYGFDEKSYLSALDKVPRWDRSKVDTVMKFYAKFATVISQLSYQNIMLQNSITERNRLQEHLKLQALVLDQIQDRVTVTDTKGKVTYANRASHEFLGYSKEEIQAMKVHDFGEDPSRGATQDEIIRETINKGSWRGEVINYRKDGSEAILDVRTRQVKDDNGDMIALCGISTDITELKSYVESLKQQKAIDELLFEMSNQLLNTESAGFDDAVNICLMRIGTLLKLARAYVFVEDKALSLVSNTHEWCADGIESQMAYMQRIPSSLTPNLMNYFYDFKDVVISDVHDLPECWKAEEEMLTSLGLKAFMAVPIISEGQAIGFLGYDCVDKPRLWNEMDIRIAKVASTLFATAKERIKYESTLIAAKEKAEEANRLKSAFLATINHELRTPLNHILGFSQLLEADPHDPDAQSYASNIRKSGTALLGIIQDIFDLALAEQSGISLNQQRYDCMAHFMEGKSSLEEILKATGKQDKIHLIFSPDPALYDAEITADISKINIVLINLFRNALKFTNSGSIEYGVEYISDEMIRYYVQDTGIGIPQNKQKIIFEFFAQAQSSLSRAYGGVGIGLAIARRMTEVLNGSLHLESTVNKGSKFTLELPVQVFRKDHQIKPSAPIGKNIPDLSERTILVADDDKNSIFVMKSYLAKTGAKILEAKNGAEAIDMVHTYPETSIILMDIQMPILDGYAASKQLLAEFPDLQIFALSAYIMEEDDPALSRAGLQSALIKPVLQEHLLKTLKRYGK